MTVSEPLLRTKILIPEEPKGQIKRVELLEDLEANIPAHRLTLVSAQAGYGKTTLLAEWARQRQSQVAWLSLDPEDNDLGRFLRYVFAAWRRLDESVVDTDFGLLLSSQESDMQDALIAFVNFTSELENDTFLILDDYHHIGVEEIHDAIAFLVEHLPNRVHLILGTRVQPPLPLPRYRARSQIYEIGPERLRFNRREADEFFERRMGLELADEQVDALQSQLEGWAGGLQLAALGAQNSEAGSSLRLVPGGSQRHLSAYLSQDVLDRLPAELQQFLMKTSILDRMCADLCRAITGVEDSQGMLERIERENLFLQCLDARGEWYRYHNMFVDFLRSELEQEGEVEVTELHSRAAEWFYDREMPEQAWDHAVKSSRLDLLDSIGSRYMPLKISRGELKVVERWLGSIPKSWFEQQPMLLLGRAAWSAMLGDFQSTMDDLELAEECLDKLDAEKRPNARARLRAFHCSAACMQNDLEAARLHGQQAAQELPENDIFYHGMINGSMGDAYRANGQWQQARRHYQQALEYSQGTDFQFLGIHAYGGLADMCLRQGNLREAADHWQNALSISEDPRVWGALPLPVIGWAFIRLAEIDYEWNRLEEAEGHLAAGMERARLGGDLRSLLAGNLLRGRLALARRKPEAASEALEEARRQVKGSQLPEWTSRYERFQLDYWLTQHDLPRAVQWIEDRFDPEVEADQSEQESVKLGVARVLLAKSNQIDSQRARGILEEIEAVAKDQGRQALRLEALALMAIAFWQRRQEAEAMRTLEQSLRLARPEGYRRTFADLGLPMARLLQEAASRKVMPDQVDQLLAIFETEMELDHAGPPLTEPLTDREIEVLELLAAGLTNKEIGQKLVISPGTVKKHAANIYGKLEVGGRTEAAARARELSLLD